MLRQLPEPGYSALVLWSTSRMLPAFPTGIEDFLMTNITRSSALIKSLRPYSYQLIGPKALIHLSKAIKDLLGGSPSFTLPCLSHVHLRPPLLRTGQGPDIGATAVYTNAVPVFSPIPESTILPAMSDLVCMPLPR